MALFRSEITARINFDFFSTYHAERALAEARKFEYFYDPERNPGWGEEVTIEVIDDGFEPISAVLRVHGAEIHYGLDRPDNQIGLAVWLGGQTRNLWVKKLVVIERQFRANSYPA